MSERKQLIIVAHYHVKMHHSCKVKQRKREQRIRILEENLGAASGSLFPVERSQINLTLPLSLASVAPFDVPLQPLDFIFLTVTRGKVSPAVGRERHHADGCSMPSFNSHAMPASSRNLMLKLPEEIRMMIYRLCMPVMAAVPVRYNVRSTSLSQSKFQIDDSKFWLRDGYVAHNIQFHMREIPDDDIAVSQVIEDAVYHKGHKFRDHDGKGTSYSIVLLDDDPEDIPRQAEQWMLQRSVADEPCDCQ